ncbi:MAG TPA: methyltransferase domain-containing protein [Candidatus Acidoferrales bacterium]|nr:methyltransferase domain-containing protein [Candidatus Acidoferrales bacterium]
MGLLPDEIEAYYRLGEEAGRLSNEWGELERLRTESILARHLPPAPALVLDVGGAAGAYAFPLAKQAYEVHLIDPVPLHLEQARSHAAASGVGLASIREGDARHIDFPQSVADAVLMLGPLYHLGENSDRSLALREARRVLRAGGVLFAASISRFASLIDGLSRGFFRDEEFRKIVANDLMHGLHRNPTNNPEYFTTAYFHRPAELASEIREAGFVDIRLLAIEGPVWSTPFFRSAWDDLRQRANLLEFLAITEGEPSILGASAHVMAVAFQPR